MRKSTIIAKCLVNSDMIERIEEAECAVQHVFIEEFPKADFTQWNQEIDSDAAKNIIRTVGRASRINVKLFIQDLW